MQTGANRNEKLELLVWLIDHRSYILDASSTIRAVASCLEPEDAVGLLVAEAQAASNLRDEALRKVLRDLKSLVLPAHIELVGSLLAMMRDATARCQASLAYCLGTLLPDLPEGEQIAIVSALLDSRYVGLRRRAYKALKQGIRGDLSGVVQAWQRFHDPECALVMTSILSPNELLGLRHELRDYLDEGWKLSRLYLRLAEVEPSVLQELLALDGVSYCYVMAKLGLPIPTSLAQELVVKNEKDERFGLVMWSLGELHNWEVIRWIGDRMRRAWNPEALLPRG